MSENSLSVSPAIEPFAGGVIGLGLGYTMAPRKYSLKRLLIMNPKRLSQIYSDDVTRQMNKGEKRALTAIMNARDEYKSSKSANGDEIRSTAKIWHDEFRKVEVPTALNERYTDAKARLQEAMRKEDYVNLNKRYREAKEALGKNPENESLKNALTTANEALAAAKIRIAAKIELYKNAVKNIYNERLYNVKNNPAKWAGVRESYNNLLIALAKRKTIASNKLFDLSNNKSLIKSYNTIKDFLPRARTKSALTGGVILGGITALMAARFSPSNAKTA